ncbi:MAG TPA: YoaK family protein [Acidimicrobiales bacterium]|nr:YoaK family protein [Acidimicrobiales bacterium]
MAEVDGAGRSPEVRPTPGGGSEPAGDAVRRRDVLVTLLALTTGATDAVSFIRLGGVFTSVMTGNIVLLGVSAGHRAASLAVHTGVAFAGYVLGVLAGTRLAGRDGGGVWPARVTLALLAEAGILAVFAAGWETTGGHPGEAAQLALVGVAALAMGAQSGTVRHLGVPGLSTTYLTGTLTGIVAGLGGHGPPRVAWRSLGLVFTLAVGAAAGAVLATEAPLGVPGLQLGALVAVIAAATVWFAGGGAPSPPAPPGRRPAPPG